MKQSYRVLTAVLVALGLSACDSGAPTVEDAPAAASSTMETSEEATESAMGAIDDAVEAMTEAGEEVMDDAADML